MVVETGLETLLDLDGMTYRLDKGYWVKFEVRPVEATTHRPHGLAYSLTLHDRNNSRVVGFDNAHGCPSPKRKKVWRSKNYLGSSSPSSREDRCV